LDAVIVAVKNINVAGRIDGHSQRKAELSVAAAQTAPLCNVSTGRIKLGVMKKSEKKRSVLGVYEVRVLIGSLLAPFSCSFN
jgi:hypothetical protein